MVAQTITKEECKEFALNKLKENGKFPTADNWYVKYGFPCGIGYLYKLFGNYKIFKKYCNHTSVITRKDCINFALNIEEKTGKLPLVSDWALKDGFPCSMVKLLSMFNNSYSIFMDSCDDDFGELYITKRSFVSKLRKMKSLEEKTAFYLKYSLDTPNKYFEEDCLIPYMKDKTIHGYYQINHNKKLIYLHKAILSLKLNKKYSEISRARHLCDNRRCINPNHLAEGTPRENAIDSRHYHKGFKLNEFYVTDIKQDMKNYNFTLRGSKTKFDKKWAKIFGVSISAIANVREERTWRGIGI